MCSYTLLQSMTVPAMPRIQSELGAGPGAVSWVLTGFLLSASVATPVIGRLGDSHGKRRMLAASLLLLALGALVAALATSIWVMVGGRVVQGLAGGVLPLSFAIIRDEMPTHRVAGAIALLASLMSVGFGAGIVLTGPILRGLGYHFLFLLPMAGAAVAALAAVALVPESPTRSRQPVRPLSVLALAGWLVALLVSVSAAPTWGWVSPRTLGGLLAAMLLFLLWVRIETATDTPVVDLQLMATPGIASANLVALLIGMAMYGSFGFLPQFTQTPVGSGYGFGASVTEAGYLMLPTAALSFVGGVASTRLARRVGGRAIVAAGCWLTSIGLLMAAFVNEEEWQILLSGGITGLGSGLCFAALANVVVEAAPVERTGLVAGMNANLRTIGGAIGSAALATMVTSRLLPSGYPAEHGYTIGFAALAAAAFLAGLTALVPRRPARRG